MDSQGTTWRSNIAENFNDLSRVHERYRQTTDRRQTTDGRTTTYSEREREFTFAKNWSRNGRGERENRRKMLPLGLLSHIHDKFRTKIEQDWNTLCCLQDSVNSVVTYCCCRFNCWSVRTGWVGVKCTELLWIMASQPVSVICIV